MGNAQQGNYGGIPAAGAFKAVTPSDTTVYDPPIAELLVTGAGDLALVDVSGNATTFTVSTAMIASGAFRLPGAFKQVKATGTTATGIYGWF